jgi:hypothetical protein
MKLNPKDNLLTVFVVAIVVAGLGLAAASTSRAAIPVSAIPVAAVKDLTYNPRVSQWVSMMREASELKKRGIQQISVLCEQDRPNSGFHVQIGYWQGGNPKTIMTQQGCNYWGQVLFMLPKSDGWKVSAVAIDTMDYYTNVVLAVYRDSAPK